jgi:hypothetical protein
MNNLPKDWIGNNIFVHVGHEPIKAKLLNINESGILIEVPNGQIYIPINSIRLAYIVLNENEPVEIYENLVLTDYTQGKRIKS